jgi:hypothetical protein
MRTFSSLIPLLITVTTLISFGGISVAALGNKNAATNSHDSRNVKATNNVQQSTIIDGSYIVRLDDKTSAAKVKTAATGTATSMQTLKLQLIANGTLQATADDVVNVPTDRIFTKSIKAFLINGVSEVMVSSLLKTTGVISVEPDTIGYGASKAEQGSSTTQKNGTLSSQAPDMWGVKKIGGPISLSEVRDPSRKIFVFNTGISPNTNALNIDPNLSVNLLDGCTPDQWGDIHGSGTAVAGLISSNTVGLVPGATLVAVKVCNDFDYCRTSDMIAGIEHVNIFGKKGDVVNISKSIKAIGTVLGISILNAAIQQTASLGIKFAIQAGDNNIDPSISGIIPATASGENIYTVSCFDLYDTLCTNSNYGDVVDVAAPGSIVATLDTSGRVTYYTGSGFSAGYIAGLLFANSYKRSGIIKGDKDTKPDPIWVYAGVLPTPAPVPASNVFTIDIYPDYFTYSQTSYELTRISPGSPTSLKSVPVYSISTRYAWSVTLTDGYYRFYIRDEGGNGIQPPGYYTLSFNGAIFKIGGSFRSLDATFFTILGSSVVAQEAAPAPRSILAPTLQPVKKGQKPKKK